MYRDLRSLFFNCFIYQAAQSHDVVQSWRLVLIPKNHGVVDGVAARVSLDHKFNNLANTSIAYNLCHLLEVGVFLADAMIGKVFLLDYLVTDNQFFDVALVKAHSTFSGKPLGGTNSPP